MEVADTHITYHIDTSLIYADEVFNCRGKIEPYHLTDLASSIKVHGLQIPIIIWPKEGLPNGCKFLLVAGYRRFLACTTILRQTTILATVRTDLTDQTARILNFTENLERKNLNILEEAKAIQLGFPKRMPMTEIGRKLNRGATWVKVRKMLLDLSETAQQAAVLGLFRLEDIKLVHGMRPCFRPHAIEQIIEARRSGRTIVHHKTLTRKNRRSRPAEVELKEMLLYLVEHRLSGLATKLIMYMLGMMSKEEIYTYIENLIIKNQMELPKVLRILDGKDREHATKKYVSKRRRTKKSQTRRRNRSK
jgi:ParB/RepB/Spo0J family partition protein